MGVATETNIFSTVWLSKFCLEDFTETTGILGDTWQHTIEKHMVLCKHLYFIFYALITKQPLYISGCFSKLQDYFQSECGGIQSLGTVQWSLCQLFHVP